jgi:hypothetical protein
MAQALEVNVHGGGPGRCAYCHDAVETSERMACTRCLAVHHAECWSADHRCASCGTSAALTPQFGRGDVREVLAKLSLRDRLRSCARCSEAVTDGKCACASCLAVHHGRCWAGSCAVCGDANALVPGEVAGASAPRPRSRGALVFAAYLLGVLVLTAAGVAALAFLRDLAWDPARVAAAIVAIFAVTPVAIWFRKRRPMPAPEPDSLERVASARAGDKAGELGDHRLEGVQGLVAAKLAGSIRLLADGLGDERKDVRDMVEAELRSRIGDPDVVAELLGRGGERETVLVARFLDLCAASDREALVPALLVLLDHGEARIREMAWARLAAVAHPASLGTFKVSGTTEKRREAVLRARSWWESAVARR